MTDYNVIAEVDIAPTERRVDGWMDALASYSPAVGRTDRSRSELVITVPANSLEQAISTGVALMTRAAGQLLTFTVMSAAEFDKRIEDVTLPELIGASEAARLMGVSRQRVQQLVDAGELQSTRVGNAIAIPRAAVEAFAEPDIALAKSAPRADGLTPREAAVLAVITERVRKDGRPPTLRELAEATGQRPTLIAHRLADLEKKGFLRRTAERRREAEPATR